MERDVIIAVSVVAGAIVLGYLAKGALVYFSRRWFSRTRTGADDVILDAVRSQIVLWFFLAGVTVALRSLDLKPVWDRVVARTTTTLFVLSTCVVISRILRAALPVVARRMSLPVTSLSGNLVRIVVFFIGATMILSTFGITIGPVLTALGVGSLAVGLALQETLGNLFAGFYLLMSREIRVGDRVELERGIGYAPHKGTVLDIGWRSSRLDMGEGNFTIVPNALVTQSIITVYSREKPPTPPPPPARAEEPVAVSR